MEQFESDSALRDKRIRHDFLESTHHPLATFEATETLGIPATVDGETTAELTMTGDLTIKETTAPVTFTGPVTVDDDDADRVDDGHGAHVDLRHRAHPRRRAGPHR